MDEGVNICGWTDGRMKGLIGGWTNEWTKQ